MPALVPTQITGTITFLGAVPHRDAPELVTNPLTEMPLTYAGYAGDTHSGVTRPSCVRVRSQYTQGTEIRNVRQLSIVSDEELTAIAQEIGLEVLDPRWLGASIAIKGIPDFTHIPPSSRLQTQDGVTLTVDMQNQPCHFPGKTIERDKPGHGKGFKAAAEGRRGVTAWVEREGTLRIGDTLTLHVPDQRAWMAQPDLFDA